VSNRSCPVLGLTLRLLAAYYVNHAVTATDKIKMQSEEMEFYAGEFERATEKLN